MPVHDWTRVDDGIFHDFHSAWIGELRKALNGGLLPPDYSALAEAVLGGITPDVLTLQGADADEGSPEGHSSHDANYPGTVALATTPPQVRLRQQALAQSYTRQQRSLVIRHRSGDRVVALIEIVSPGNKATDFALGQLVDKTIAALHRGIHVLILDLIPPGRRDPQGIHGIIWRELAGVEYTAPADALLTLVAYSAGLVKEAFVEPTRVGAILCDMPLFLEAEHYVPVPLEATYAAAFAGTAPRYRRRLEA